MALIADDSIVLRLLLKGQEKFNKGVKEAREQSSGLGRSFRNIGDFVKGNLITSGLLSLGGAIRDVGSNMLQSAVQSEQTALSFEVFTGSVANANKLIAELNEFSIRTPFRPEEILSVSKTLLGFSRSTEDVIGDIEILGNVAAATNSDIGNLGLVFGQVAGVGKLLGQDANQFISAGIPIYSILSESIGVSVGQVKELQSQGKITFDVLRKAFVDASADGGRFENALLKSSKTIGGLFSTLQGVGQQALKELGEAFLPLLRTILPPLIDLGFKFIDVVKVISDNVGSRLVPVFKFVFDTVSPLRGVFEGMIENFISIKNKIDEVLPSGNLFAGVFAAMANGATAFGNVFNAIFGNDIVQNVIRDLVLTFAAVPAVFNGLVEAGKAVAENLSISFDSIGLRADLLVADLKGIFSAEDAIIADGLRKQIAAIDENKVSVADAFKNGFEEVFTTEIPAPKIGKVKVDVEVEVDPPPPPKPPEGLSKEQKKALEKFQKEVADTERLLEDLRLEAITDPADKARAELELERKRRLEGLKGTIEQRAELTKLINQDIDAALSGLENRDFGLGSVISSLPTGLDADLVREEAQEILDVIEEMKLQADLVAEGGEGGDGESFFDKIIGNGNLEDIKEQALKLKDVAFGVAKDLADAEIEKADAEVDAQKDKIEQLKNEEGAANAEQIEAEEERLNGLLKAQSDAIEKKKKLAAVENAISSTVAIAQAIQGAIAAFAQSPLLGIIQIAAVGASIAGLVGSLKGAFSENSPTFHDGTESLGERPFRRTSGRLRSDEMMIKAQKKERILSVQDNAPLLAMGVKNKDIPTLVKAGLEITKNSTIVNSKETNTNQQNFSTIKKVLLEQQSILPILKAKPLSPMRLSDEYKNIPGQGGQLIETMRLDGARQEHQFRELVETNKQLIKQNEQIIKRLEAEKTFVDINEKGIAVITQKMTKQMKRRRK